MKKIAIYSIVGIAVLLCGMFGSHRHLFGHRHASACGGVVGTRQQPFGSEMSPPLSGAPAEVPSKWSRSMVSLPELQIHTRSVPTTAPPRGVDSVTPCHPPRATTTHTAPQTSDTARRPAAADTAASRRHSAGGAGRCRERRAQPVQLCALRMPAIPAFPVRRIEVGEHAKVLTKHPADALQAVLCRRPLPPPGPSS